MHPVYRFFATGTSFAPVILRALLALISGVHAGQRTFGWMDGPGWKATLAQLTAPAGLHLPYLVRRPGWSPAWLRPWRFSAVFAPGSPPGVILLALTLGIYGARWEQGFLLGADFQFPFTLGGVAIALMICGGGRFSVDRAITRQLLPPDTGWIG